MTEAGQDARDAFAAGGKRSIATTNRRCRRPHRCTYFGRCGIT